MAPQTHDQVRQAVQARYGTIAETRGATTCCESARVTTLDEKAHRVGYSPEDTQTVPEGANLGLGCGNPVAIASLRPGDVVVDLGSGAGFDCFLAAQAVGATGKVIGVDMTPAMLIKSCKLLFLLEKISENFSYCSHVNSNFCLLSIIIRSIIGPCI